MTWINKEWPLWVTQWDVKWSFTFLTMWWARPGKTNTLKSGLPTRLSLWGPQKWSGICSLEATRISFGLKILSLGKPLSPCLRCTGCFLMPTTIRAVLWPKLRKKNIRWRTMRLFFRPETITWVFPFINKLFLLLKILKWSFILSMGCKRKRRPSSLIQKSVAMGAILIASLLRSIYLVMGLSLNRLWALGITGAGRNSWLAVS